MNVMPGVQVRTEKPADLRFNNFFFRESVIDAKAALEIADFAGFTQMLAKYPLVDAKGEALFTAAELANQKKAEAKLNKAIAEKDFFKNNQADFERWHIEWSDRTAALLNKAGAELNRSAIIDFFNGVVGEKVVRQGALTAAWANDSEFLGQAGYDAAKMQYAALYPVSETKYEGNATVFTLENTTKETREITIVQVQDCIAGYMAKKDRQGVQDSSFVLVPSARFPKGVKFSKQVGDREVRGLEFYNEKPLAESDFNGCMGVSVAWNKKDNLNVSVKPMFYQDDAPG